MGQVALKTALEAICFQKSEFSRKALKTNEKSITMSPRAVPKRPKILPRRPQDGLEEVFFRVDFYHRFWSVLGSDFGAIWDPFWEPKPVIFGIDFWMLFACRSKIAPRAPKSGPRATKSLPRASQEHPRAAQERPRASQEPPKSAQERPKSGQEGPRAAKSEPRGPKSGKN